MSTSSIKAGEAYVEIATRQGLLNRGLASATARIAMFGKSISSMTSGLAGKLDFGSILGSSFFILPAMLKLVTVGFGAVLSVLGSVVGLFVSLGSTLVGLIGWPLILVAGVTALGVALLYYTDAGGAALNWLGGVWQWLLDTVLPVLQAIVNALMSGDFALAGQILWTSLQLLWMEGTKSLYDIWIDFRTQFMNAIDPLLQPLMEIWSAVAEAALIAWNGISSTWNSVASSISGSFDGISMQWGMTVQSMSDMWNDTVNWIAKKLLYLYSLFDWSLDYEAAAKDMDAQNEAKKRANRQGGEQRNAQRQKEAEQLKDTFSEEIIALRQKLQEEMAQVSDDGFQMKLPEGFNNFVAKAGEFASKFAGIAAGMMTNMPTNDIAGTFSGFAALGLTGQSAENAANQRATMISLMEAELAATRAEFAKLTMAVKESGKANP